MCFELETCAYWLETLALDIVREKSSAWVAEYGGAQQNTPRAAAEGAEFVMACVGNDHDLRSVVLGDDGALEGMSDGSVFVEHDYPR